MKNKVEIIAEAGLNHNGKIKNAIKLIQIAKAAGADYIKFQLYKTSHLINRNYQHETVNYEEMYKKFYNREFSQNQWEKIINHAKKRKIKIFFSVFDLPSIDLIKKFNIKILKIPSGEINNVPLLKKINSLRFKVILSTGMSTLKEIKKAINILKNCEVKILYCVSEYPTLNPNLKTINFFKKNFKKVIGFSDHTKEIITPALAVAAGAEVIEKHFTYYKNQKIGDHNFSLNPNELIEMVKNIRIAEKFLGTIKRNISSNEKQLQFFARKGIYLNKEKFKNEIISIKDLDILRPEGGCKISNYKKIINKKLKKNLKKGQSLNFFLNEK